MPLEKSKIEDKFSENILLFILSKTWLDLTWSEPKMEHFSWKFSNKIHQTKSGQNAPWCSEGPLLVACFSNPETSLMVGGGCKVYKRKK